MSDDAESSAAAEEVVVAEDIHDSNENRNMQSEEEVPQTKRQRVGKPVHQIWSDAFNNPDVHSPQSPNNAACKHCKQSFRHHHKTSVVEAHLRECKPFIKLMLDQPVSERPDWWNKSKSEATKKSKVAASTSSSSTSQSNVRLFAIPHFTATEQKKFNLEMAMHYCTGTSFVWIEDPHLLQAIQLAQPAVRLPTRKQLADDSSGGLLEVCFQNAKEDAKKLPSAKSQYVSITNDAWSSILNEPVINYMAVSLTRSLFLEAVHTEEQ